MSKCLNRVVFLSNIFSYIAKDLSDVIKIKSINNVSRETVIYYGNLMWNNIKTVWFEVAEVGNVDMMLGLINSGIDINTKNNNGNTALIYASMYGNEKIVEILCKMEGIDLNAKGYCGNTTLIWAINKNNCIEILEKYKKV